MRPEAANLHAMLSEEDCLLLPIPASQVRGGPNRPIAHFLVPSCHAEPVNHPWSSRKSPSLHDPELPWTPGFDRSTEVADATSIGLAVDERDILGDGNLDTEGLFGFTDSALKGKDIAARPPMGVPAAPRRLDLADLHAALESNFSYAMDRIRAAPSNMLLENQTPWCHPLLFRETMPRVMQEAVSACALHASMNAVNSRVIIRCIETKVDDLIGSAPQPEALDALARTQALLLYQTIRFFDGDVLARSSADATFCELESSIHALHEHVSWDIASSPDMWLTTSSCHVNNPSLSLPQPSREFWKAWVYQESARRTFLVASFFVYIWKMLTGQPLVQRWDDEELRRQCWTLSAHLWGAGNSFDFAAAWRDRKHLVVRRGAIRSTMMNVEAGDVEAFGKMLMTAALGVDETEDWLASMGAKL
ncbi:hypothetical protein INS49_012749 [Diaporthe citri]|uniref:uncharacterized protein n=1 Tax=Diaporthe citri TaxID=83186 RepID=UPI001C7E8F82|nr:uncharacterized protein INS49_012749 [Diaporthe citri]KAG6359228.1 hypothetical protein INS49_012749 [Diaporthe citri]